MKIDLSPFLVQVHRVVTSQMLEMMQTEAVQMKVKREMALQIAEHIVNKQEGFTVTTNAYGAGNGMQIVGEYYIIPKNTLIAMMEEKEVHIPVKKGFWQRLWDYLVANW